MNSYLRYLKLLFVLVLIGTGTGAFTDDASASHYRGGAMVPRVSATGELTLTTTTYWRKDFTASASPTLSGVPLTQASGVTDTSDSRFNAVVQTHTAQLTPGTQTITWASNNRVSGINNASEAGWQLTSKIYWDGSSANTPIYFDLGAVQPEVVSGESYAGSLGAVPGNGGTLSYDQALALSINSQPPGFTIDPSTGELAIPMVSVGSWQQNTAGNVGADYAFSGNIFSSDGSQVQFDWLFDLVSSGAGVARAPVITDGSVSAASGDTVSYQFSGSDANGDALTWTFLDLLGNEALGASFDASTRTLSWDTTGSPAGTYVVLVRASDGSKTDTGQLTVTLGPPQQAPVVSDGTASATIGQTVSHTFAGTDANGDPLTWSFVDLLGNEALGASFDASTRTLTWDTTGSPAGTYVVRVQASDGVRTDIGELTITLAVPPTAPVVGNGSASANPGDTVSHQFGGSDANGDPLTWSFVDLVGNETLPGSFDAGTQTFTWDTAGSPAGTYVVRVRASDGVLNGIGELTVTVAQAVPVVADGATAATSGDTVTYTFSGSDANGDPLIWTLVDLVGGEALPASFDAAARKVTWNTSGTPSGKYVIVVRASDGSTNGTGRLTITLGAAPVVAVPAAPVVGDGSSFAVEVPETVATGPVSRLIAPPQVKTGYARTLDVVLAIDAPSDAELVWISDDPSFTSGRLVPVSHTGRYDWRLPGDGERNVYVRFVNGGGASGTLTEKVLVDVTKPKLLWAKFIGAGRKPGAGLTVTLDFARKLARTKQRSWITVHSTDDLSGLAWMQYGPAKAKPFAWRNILPKASVRVSRKATFVWLRVADRAGNVSDWLKVPVGKQIVKTKKSR